LNEAAIDDVEGDAKAGIVNDASRPLAIDELIAANQASDEADVTTGWHAIEFLLWGQDLSDKGPGARPASHYAPGKGVNDRRRAYLAAVTKQLVDDLRLLHSRWTTSDGDAYLAKFLGLPQREAIGRILNGMAILAGFEFMSERLAVALDSGDQEDEHSCFSDTTKQDFRYDLEGIKAVWTGKGPVAERPGLESLVASRDKALAARVSALIGEAGKNIAALGDIGLTMPYATDENCSPAQTACLASPRGDGIDLSADFLARLTDYTRLLAVPARRGANEPAVLAGEELFAAIGCAQCHRERMRAGDAALPELAGQTFFPFTDLLLHDMGEALADNRPDGLATGSEWRTPPLWGLGLVPRVNGHDRLLHDGRARGFAEAILWHGGEAERARERFRNLEKREREALIAFLGSL
jgi:hypothetical protein